MTPTIEPVRNCHYLAGPTGSGKTPLGVELARRLEAEIVSMDSMAIYRGMDIGTAKPTAAERKAVPHHLLDLIEPSQEFSLAQYVEAAHRAVDEIRGRGREVLFVGGTPLYLKALLRGIFEGPPADWPFRRRLEELARNEGAGALHDRLVQVDPVAAARLHPNDLRRIIRALEVYEKTGEPISRHQRQFEAGHVPQDSTVFVLNWPRDELDARIDARVEEMFRTGLVDEVRQLMTNPGGLSRTARQAVGYPEVLQHLAQQRDLAQTVELVKLRTRQFARRQMTWFRSLAECQSVELHEPLDPAKVADHVMHSLARLRGSRKSIS